MLLPLAGPAAAVSFANTAPISIPLPGATTETNASPYPSNIAVSGLSGTVTDVNVTLCGFSATFPSDVDVMLVAPDGTRAVIMSDVGGDGEFDNPVTNVNVTLDDSAANPLPADAGLVSGTYRPLDDDQRDFDPDLLNVDRFFPPAPSPTDPVGVFRPANGVWFFHSDADNVALSSFNGVNPNGTWSLYVMDDVAGGPDDGENQLPTFSCGWSIDVTGGGSGVPAANGTIVPFGTTGDIPVPGDYDGNGSIDTAVYRPSSGIWFVQGGITVAWGTAGDIPVPGDYDGDGDTDIAVFRPSNGLWFVRGGETVAFGTNGDVPVPADYDGDDDTDMAVFRPSNGYWFIQGVGTFGWGTNGDMPVPADYNNDGSTDIAVFRPSTGTWFVRDGASVTFGTSGDVPLALPPAIKAIFFP